MSKNRPKKKVRETVFCVALAVVAVPSITAIADISSLQKTDLAEKSSANPLSAKLQITSKKKNICPTEANFSGWIITNEPGIISYTIENQNGKVEGPFVATAVKSVQGGMAIIKSRIEIKEAIDTKFTVVTHSNNGKLTSNWAPLVAKCGFMLKG